MKFPYPEKISLQWAAAFATVLLCSQLAVGTGFYFASCVFVYIMLAVYAFNMVGGFYRASGAFIFFNSVNGLILSQCVKVIVGEPANSNLYEPNRTITVYLIGMMGMTFAAIATRRIRPAKSIVDDIKDIRKLPQMAVGCFAMGAAYPWISQLYATDAGSGTAWSALNQLNFFLPLSVVLSTYSVIKASNGARSVNAMVLITVGYSTLVGVFNFSKQGAFAPMVAYLLTCAALRFRFKAAQIVFFCVFGAVSLQFLVPMIQMMKGAAEYVPTATSKFNMEVDLLSHPVKMAADYKVASEADHEASVADYYDKDMGLMGRFSLIAISSLLIEYTDHGHLHGWDQMVLSLESVIPHFIWPDKPQGRKGNTYARELGILGEDDTTTGITFPLVSEAYTLGGLTGVFLVSSILLTLYFFAFDSLVGDIRNSPWGLVVFVFFAHAAPEMDASGLIPDALVTTLKIWATIMLARHVLPALGNLFRGPDKTHIVRIASARSIRRRPGFGPRVPPQNMPAATGD